jgi:hypothetical protein
MSEQLPPNQPKKPPRNSKAKKLNINVKKRWQDIVNNVEKKEVPVEILHQIIVMLVDGTNITINVRDLIAEGNRPEDIEAMLDAKFADLDQYIKNVDFFVDIDKVVNTVQPETNKVLKGL